MNAIEFKNARAVYPGERKPSVHNITFSVREGEFLCLIGASGCGKTTILKLIAGIEHADAGEIKTPERVAMAFQFGALFPWLTVYENIALGLRQMALGEEEIRHAVERELHAMQIQAFKYKYPSDLSGGQRQRVGIARALAVDPHVLLLDEPFSALDAKTTAELHDDIISVWRRTGKTIIMVSHQIEEAVSLAERVLLMKNGTIADEFKIDLPYPRRESDGYHRDVMKIRREFFK
jgi:NitT/TauT family transport system ATP-binding protein